MIGIVVYRGKRSQGKNLVHDIPCYFAIFLCHLRVINGFIAAFDVTSECRFQKKALDKEVSSSFTLRSRLCSNGLECRNVGCDGTGRPNTYIGDTRGKIAILLGQTKTPAVALDVGVSLKGREQWQNACHSFSGDVL